MKVLILSPEKIIFQGKADSIYSSNLNGYFQILNNHAPIITILKKGKISLYISTIEKLNCLHFLIKGGILEVKNNIVTIMVD